MSLWNTEQFVLLWKAVLSMLFRKRYIFLSFGKWYISCHLERS